MDKNFIEYQNDCIRFLKTNKDNLIAKKITELSWEISFDKKDMRIEKINKFIIENQCKTVIIEGTKYDTLELMISFSHFRRAKF
jgi:hypothetical protein